MHTTLKVTGLLFLALFYLGIVLFKVNNLHYNSPFNDEAVYVIVGQLGLFYKDWESLSPFNWVGGIPYLYPVLTALFYSIGGIELTRLVNVLFFLFSLYFIYRITFSLRIGDKNKKRTAALIACLVLGYSQTSHYVSRLATYDAPGFFLMIVAVFFMIAASKPFQYPGKYYFLSALFLLLSFFVKYSSGVFIPLLVSTSFLLINRLDKTKRKIWLIYQITPIALALSFFILQRHQSLLIFYHDQMRAGTASLMEILNIWWLETRYSLLIFVPGSIGLFIKKRYRLWLGILLFSTALLIVHFQSMRSATLDKHLIYYAAGISIIGGLGMSELYEFGQKKTTRAFSKISIILILFLFVHLSAREYFKYDLLWTNTESVHNYIVDSVDANTVVVSQLGASTQLALLNKTPISNIFTFDWIAYGDLIQEKALVKGIDDGYFDLIILEPNNPFYSSDHQQMLQLTEESVDESYSINYQSDNFLVYQRSY